eukprot:m.107967 g.107967  ORF g.107967 m.107967 type:complete len:420 (-) comp9183_c1_seq1:28-1287(-)
MQASVIDVGSCFTRVGVASALLPSSIVSTRALVNGDTDGGRVIQHGIVKDWTKLEGILNTFFRDEDEDGNVDVAQETISNTMDTGGDELATTIVQTTIDAEANSSPENETTSTSGTETTPSSSIHVKPVDIYQRYDREAPLLVVDAPTSTDKARGRMCELAFESVGVPAYYALDSLVSSVYSAGRISSYVFDIGYDSIHAGVVHDGFLFPHTYRMINTGGKDVTKSFQMYMADRGYEMSYERAEELKLKHCFAATDFAKESSQLILSPTEDNYFTLPDGHSVAPLGDVGMRSIECLFHPALARSYGVGLSDVLVDITIMCQGDREVAPLRTLPLFYLGVGGGSQIRSLPNRLYSDLIPALPVSTKKTMFANCVENAPDRHHAAWIGGSIVSSLPQFVDNNFVSKAEYEESGVAALHKRC